MFRTGSSDWNNGTYQHILKAENTEVVINGGTFDATIQGMTNAMINVSENSVVTINAGTFKNVNGVIPQFAPYMFTYEKKLQFPVNIKNPNPKYAQIIISQYGGTFQNVRATYLTPPKYAF